jgi:hypothetical protein
MHDHSHKLLFLTATALMCAIAMYGSQTGPARLSATAQATSFTPDALASTNEPIASEEPGFLANEVPPPSTATVLPNGVSCPAANVGTLLSPPSVNETIGPPPPAKPLPRAEAQTGAVLGTGTACPPAAGDRIASKPDSLTEIAPEARSPIAVSPLARP